MICFTTPYGGEALKTFKSICRNYSLMAVSIPDGYGSFDVHVCRTGPDMRLLESFTGFEVESMTDEQMELIVAEAALGEVASWT